MTSLSIDLFQGEILAQGNYEELMEQNIDFVDLIAGEEVQDPSRKESVISLKKVSSFCARQTINII
jgi:hypothetical protein